MTAVCVLLAVCLIAMTITAIACVKDMNDSHAEAMRQADARRVAEVALATAGEGLIAARDAVDHASSLHKAERERADVLEEELHDAEVFIATGGNPRDAATTSRGRLLSAIKRSLNHAAGPNRARGEGDREPEPVPVVSTTRTVGDAPTRAGDK